MPFFQLLVPKPLSPQSQWPKFYTQYTIQEKISSSINNDLFTTYVYCTCIVNEHMKYHRTKMTLRMIIISLKKPSLFSLSLAPEQPFVWLWVCWDYFLVANQPTRSEKRINMIRYLRFDFLPYFYQWNDKHLTLDYSHIWIISLNIHLHCISWEILTGDMWNSKEDILKVKCLMFLFMCS